MIWSGESNPQHLITAGHSPTNWTHPATVKPAAGPVNLTFYIVGREFKKASVQDFEEMLIALHCNLET